MAKHIFLSGHGGWTPERGYTTVPKGCKVHFYTHFAKNLITGMEHKILEGSHTGVDRTIEEFRACPNLRLSHQPEEWTKTAQAKLAKRKDPDCVLLESPAEGLTLDELFRGLEKELGRELADVEFHWMACQTLSLKQVGGRATGLNAGDFAHDASRPGRYRVKNADGSFSWL